MLTHKLVESHLAALADAFDATTHYDDARYIRERLLPIVRADINASQDKAKIELLLLVEKELRGNI